MSDTIIKTWQFTDFNTFYDFIQYGNNLLESCDNYDLWVSESTFIRDDPKSVSAINQPNVTVVVYIKTLPIQATLDYDTDTPDPDKTLQNHIEVHYKSTDQDGNKHDDKITPPSESPASIQYPNKTLPSVPQQLIDNDPKNRGSKKAPPGQGPSDPKKTTPESDRRNAHHLIHNGPYAQQNNPQKDYKHRSIPHGGFIRTPDRGQPFNHVLFDMYQKVDRETLRHLGTVDFTYDPTWHVDTFQFTPIETNLFHYLQAFGTLLFEMQHHVSDDIKQKQTEAANLAYNYILRWEKIDNTQKPLKGGEALPEQPPQPSLMKPYENDPEVTTFIKEVDSNEIRRYMNNPTLFFETFLNVQKEDI